MPLVTDGVKAFSISRIIAWHQLGKHFPKTAYMIEIKTAANPSSQRKSEGILEQNRQYFKGDWESRLAWSLLKSSRACLCPCMSSLLPPSDITEHAWSKDRFTSWDLVKFKLHRKFFIITNWITNSCNLQHKKNISTKEWFKLFTYHSFCNNLPPSSIRLFPALPTHIELNHGGLPIRTSNSIPLRRTSLHALYPPLHYRPFLPLIRRRTRRRYHHHLGAQGVELWCGVRAVLWNWDGSRGLYPHRWVLCHW